MNIKKCKKCTIKL